MAIQISTIGTKNINSQNLGFEEALYYLSMGVKLSRLKWNEPNSYVFIKNGILLHNKPFHPKQERYMGGYPFVLAQDDIECNDWVIVKYPKNI